MEQRWKKLNKSALLALFLARHCAFPCSSDSIDPNGDDLCWLCPLFSFFCCVTRRLNSSRVTFDFDRNRQFKRRTKQWYSVQHPEMENRRTSGQMHGMHVYLCATECGQVKGFDWKSAEMVRYGRFHVWVCACVCVWVCVNHCLVLRRARRRMLQYFIRSVIETHTHTHIHILLFDLGSNGIQRVFFLIRFFRSPCLVSSPSTGPLSRIMSHF